MTEIKAKMLILMEKQKNQIIETLSKILTSLDDPCDCIDVSEFCSSILFIKKDPTKHEIESMLSFVSMPSEEQVRYMSSFQVTRHTSPTYFMGTYLPLSKNHPTPNYRLLRSWRAIERLCCAAITVKSLPNDAPFILRNGKIWVRCTMIHESTNKINVFEQIIAIILYELYHISKQYNDIFRRI